MSEVDQVRIRYQRRKDSAGAGLYSPLQAATYLGTQELERALIRCIRTCRIEPVEDKRVLEIGCGTGGNLLRLIQLGFDPEKLAGNELLEDRAAIARKRLPVGTAILVGDAAELTDQLGTFDIVMQSTVFTSLLDGAFQKKLADRMWELVGPGGGVLWYDFIYDNPGNPDVRGVPLKRVEQLFPAARIRAWKVTLAPPISRRITKVNPALYGLFNLLPLLRTHILCWIQK